MNPLHRLSLYGVTASLIGDKIELSGVDCVPPEDISVVQALIEEVKANKRKLVEALRWQAEGFTSLCAADGPLQEVEIEASDLPTLQRWKAALDSGLIALEGRLQYRSRQGTVTIRYRSEFPRELIQ